MERNTSGYTVKEDIANTVTHGIGFVISILAVSFLIFKAYSLRSYLHLFGYSVYGISLLAIYFASTMYHHVQCEVKKPKWQKIDLICIYFYIAGSYTPFMLLSFKGSEGLNVLLGVWAIAIVGTLYKVFKKSPNTFVSLLSYLAMGWFIVTAWNPFLESISDTVFYLILSGGICYCIGVIFYLVERLDYNHAYWHLCVMAGSAFHFYALHLAT